MTSEGPRTRLREAFYRGLEVSPRLWCAYNRRRDRSRSVVGPDSDICIEGNPAAANSYLRELLLAAHPGLRIGSHLHRVGHVKAALRFGVPTVVLLRDPKASARSVLLRFPEGRTPVTELARYQDFYRRVRPLAGRVGLIRFEDATSRPGAALAANGAALGVDFPPIDDADTATVERALDQIERYTAELFGAEAVAQRQARPSELRARQAEELEPAFAEPRAVAVLARARALHDELDAIAAERLARWQEETTP